VAGGAEVFGPVVVGFDLAVGFDVVAALAVASGGAVASGEPWASPSWTSLSGDAAASSWWSGPSGRTRSRGGCRVGLACGQRARDDDAVTGQHRDRLAATRPGRTRRRGQRVELLGRR